MSDAHHRTAADYVASTHNTARFFTEHHHIAWVLFAGTLLWGLFAYVQMPKKKDPDTTVIFAAALCPWPGASAGRVEQLVTRKLEEKIGENVRVNKIQSISRSNISIVLIELDETTPIRESGSQFNDLALRLKSINDLPPGAGPIEFLKDFGDTAALMLTVASPQVSGVDLALRARTVRAAIERTRATAPPGAAANRVTLVGCFPASISATLPARQRDLIAKLLEANGFGRDLRALEDGGGFVGIDMVPLRDVASMTRFLSDAMVNRLMAADFHPDVWPIALIRAPEETEARLGEVAGDKYSYRDLDRFTELIVRAMHGVPLVSKVYRAGVLPEEIVLDYSQERLASIGLRPSSLADILTARNLTLPGGMVDVQGKQVGVDPSGEFTNEKEIGNVIVGASDSGRPVYLRDVAEVSRTYQTPATYLNFFSTRTANGTLRRSRAITLALQMKQGQQIAEFGARVNAALDGIQHELPEDLIIARPSDQARQVDESIELFMRSLYEAIGLVILVALVGFWEWRSALLMAIGIPVTLAMTFGFMHLLKIDLQSVSIASLIIGLGLLVDDPVVAGDAMKREMEAGQPRSVAAWLGPTRLAAAIMFATITNIVAYLPMLTISGSLGVFIYSLPVVLACSLVASRLVSMTFIPLLGQYLLRPPARPERPMSERRSRGFTGWYYRRAGWAVDHRWMALGFAILLLGATLGIASTLRVQFFPKDLSYLSYVDVWLPEDATITATTAASAAVERVVAEVIEAYGREHPDEHGKPRRVLDSLTTFVGGGGPRFWFSVAPELLQTNYAQVIINVLDKHDTAHLITPLQHALSERIPGARIDVRQLETGKPIGIPVAIRIAGENMAELRRQADRAKAMFQAVPIADRVRDDWGAESFKVRLVVDPDRANLAGVSNLDVALSSIAGLNGLPVTTMREGNEQIPVKVRMRLEERGQLSDLRNLYIYAQQSDRRAPLSQVSHVEFGTEAERIRRRNQFRTITVSAFPQPGALPSELLNALRPGLARFAASLPPGYRMEIGGEEEEQVKGFGELSLVMIMSVAAIFLALVFQFKNAVKPLIVFSAIPFGVAGALLSLLVMGAPFGFMAFLGIASLIGVIVSHVIVLFDFIEEMHAKGEPLRDALLDAGIVRLRPVLITVGATVFGLIPLALHGGPLWEPLCYAQIGGLTVATAVTLFLVPVLYAIFVLDLKIVKWSPGGGAGPDAPYGVPAPADSANRV